MASARASCPVWGPTGVLYFASDRTGVAQAFRLDGADRAAVQVANNRLRTLPVAAVQGGLLVRQDDDGGEIWQLTLVGPDGGQRRLTRDLHAIHRTVRVDPNGGRAGISYNPKGGVDWALGTIDLRSGEIETWTAPDGNWGWMGWDPSGRRAMVARIETGLKNQAFVVDGPGGEMTPILPDARLVSTVFFASGGMYAITNLDREYLGLVEVDRADPRRIFRRLVDEDGDVLGAVPSPSGELVTVIHNRGLYDQLSIHNLVTGETRAPEVPRPGVVYTDNTTSPADQIAWDSDSRRLFVAWESSTAPAEICEVISGTRWTTESGDPIPGLVEPSLVHFTTFDGLQIPALHYKLDDRPRPTMVYFHGGPESQSRANFQPGLAIWNAAGLNVLAPNVRGSTGHGVSYEDLDNRELRWDAVRDGVAAGRWAQEHGGATHLVVMGTSYGGFMTLAVLIEDPELWVAAVDVVGIADWHDFFRTTSGWRRSSRVPEYGEPNGPDGLFLARFSPLARAAEIRADLLIVHGRNDPRVPLSQAEKIHAAVAGSELMVLDDEGHGIVKHANRALAYGRALDFVLERLGREGSA